VGLREMTKRVARLRDRAGARSLPSLTYQRYRLAARACDGRFATAQYMVPSWRV
jgi:hypothetical protein